VAPIQIDPATSIAKVQSRKYGQVVDNDSSKPSLPTNVQQGTIQTRKKLSLHHGDRLKFNRHKANPRPIFDMQRHANVGWVKPPKAA
jgi:hypothetical protein